MWLGPFRLSSVEDGGIADITAAALHALPPRHAACAGDRKPAVRCRRRRTAREPCRLHDAPQTRAFSQAGILVIARRGKGACLRSAIPCPLIDLSRPRTGGDLCTDILGARGRLPLLSDTGPLFSSLGSFRRGSQPKSSGCSTIGVPCGVRLAARSQASCVRSSCSRVVTCFSVTRRSRVESQWR